MKKVFKVDELDCANCAAKMEAALLKLPGVISAQINFMAQKLTLEAEDSVFDDVVRRAETAMRKIERNVRLSS